MAISIVGAVAVVVVYWAIWYAAKGISKRLKPIKEEGINTLWKVNAGALLGSGALFVGAGFLNPATGANGTATTIAALVTVIVLGTFAVVGVKRTARVKAAEVAAAKIPNGYTIKTKPDPQPAAYVPSFAEKIGAARAESIIEEIKAGSW